MDISFFLWEALITTCIFIWFIHSVSNWYSESMIAGVCPYCKGHNKNTNSYMRFGAKIFDGLTDEELDSLDCLACDGGKTYIAYQRFMDEVMGKNNDNSQT